MEVSSSGGDAAGNLKTLLIVAISGIFVLLVILILVIALRG